MDEKLNNSTSILSFLLAHDEYHLLQAYLAQEATSYSKRLTPFLQLAQAILDVDLLTVNQLLPILPNTIPTLDEDQLELYCFMMSMEYKFNKGLYGDYFRALTPVLVKIYYLIIERKLIPDLSSYIQPLFKESEDGARLYKGKVWSQEAVEASDNRIARSWKKYYGDRFNYTLYISSSHLVKLIDDYCHDRELVELVDQIRQIEKNIRNILAHEIVCADDEWIYQRVKLTPKTIEEKVVTLARVAGLDDLSEHALLNQLKQCILNEYKQLTETKE